MNALEMAQKAAFFANEKKAEKILILEVAKLTSYTDYFVICEAPSERQVSAIAQNILDEMAKLKKKPLGVEGLEFGNWALCDFGDVVVHVFLEGLRHHYNLDGFWHEAAIIPCEF
ncbi:MAG: ribosome silencing factor [Myxococcota bacterium]